jgi:hypothetical protein
MLDKQMKIFQVQVEKTEKMKGKNQIWSQGFHVISFNPYVFNFDI